MVGRPSSSKPLTRSNTQESLSLTTNRIKPVAIPEELVEEEDEVEIADDSSDEQTSSEEEESGRDTPDIGKT